MGTTHERSAAKVVEGAEVAVPASVAADPGGDGAAASVVGGGAGGGGASVVVTGTVVRRRRQHRLLHFWDVCRKLGGDVGESKGGGGADGSQAGTRELWEIVEVLARDSGMASGEWKLASSVRVGDVVTCHGELERAPSFEHDASGVPVRTATGASAEEELGVRDGGCVLLREVSVGTKWVDAHPGIHFQVASHAPEPVAIAQMAGWKPGVVAAKRRRVEPDGGDTTQVCKFWTNTGRCYRPDCHMAHPTGEALKRARMLWSEKRRTEKDARNGLEGDPFHASDKASKTARARLFVEFMLSTFGEAQLSGGTGVIDVAGGRGGVAFELHVKRHITCTLIDPRPMKLDKSQHKFLRSLARGRANTDVADVPTPTQYQTLFDDVFTSAPEHVELLRGCGLVCGLHPDQATEPIVDQAIKLGKPFAVVPCCVFSKEFPERRLPDGKPVFSYEDFVTYLKAKTPGIESAFLPFSGKNQVLFWRGPTIEE